MPSVLDKKLVSSYYSLVKALARGSNNPRRPGLPENVVRRVCLLANLSIQSPSLSRDCSEAIVVPSRGPEVALPWFHTVPIASQNQGKITGVQLLTFSHDQGWVSDNDGGTWTWFQIHVKTPSGGSTSWMSHKNRMASPNSEFHSGQLFDSSHEMLSGLHVGDYLEVTANAQFPGWTNYAEKGNLRVFVQWEPSSKMMKLIYSDVRSTGGVRDG